MAQLLFHLFFLFSTIPLLHTLRLSHSQNSTPCSSTQVEPQFLTTGMKVTEGRGPQQRIYTISFLSWDDRSVEVYQDSETHSTVRRYWSKAKVPVAINQTIHYKLLTYIAGLQKLFLLGEAPDILEMEVPAEASSLKDKLGAINEEETRGWQLVVEVTCDGLKPVDVVKAEEQEQSVQE